MTAETYVHRCGRTARIGKPGFSFSLFSPEDEKAFRLIYSALNKGKVFESATGETTTENDIREYEVDFQLLMKQRGLIEKAKAVEKELFHDKKEKANADWLMNLSKQTGIEIPDELKAEVACLG